MSYNELFDKAEEAFKTYSKTTAAEKAKFLRAIATEVEQLGEKLLETASQESNLPLARLTGERGRTTGQLRLFASLLEEGTWVEATIDTALPDRTPLPRPDLRRMLIPLGPVVVFGASNFPLAFSTAGGDTASALAAGCTVVYKEHPGHPKTSQMVAKAIEKALQACELPEGVFQHVSGGIEAGQDLVKHPKAKAIAFTGSYKGGRAIFDLACQREQPIPVYAEMGSINPVFVLPAKAGSDAPKLAEQVAQSVLLGVGQFCTCPGLVFFPESETAESFLQTLSNKLAEAPAVAMLNDRICSNYHESLKHLAGRESVDRIITPDEDVLTAGAALAKTNVRQWVQDKALQEEIFGPYTLIVTYTSLEELELAASELQGQLTCTVWGEAEELAKAADLVAIIRDKCGRLLFEGVPTGVEVSYAMTHGGPFPATTDSRSTSVGTYAIKRFARPVTYQAAPQVLLPEELKDENSLHIWRTVNGQLTQESL
ncbi:aldehyde dehydrogenase (NADP(+)) [Pontibacter sp. SGAir0037]|uniref:aldehyde dehydrogenase (NADP(+)) n=1 Tax=Pontibacter sp. SGAir0037 TaxID=2571030 RepID=UPI0010CD397D|nr:aldehyde dehydrogenase (NADP(+)) [Pontibacter sp. SGAir0037]QCR22291.1 aldehyde dehydrogenase (NADP(+)) [Pontibacter sp. SGAir0037]